MLQNVNLRVFNNGTVGCPYQFLGFECSANGKSCNYLKYRDVII